MDLDAIESQLLQHARSEKRRWQEMAELLISVERDGLWRGHTRSFTAWVDTIARRADLQSSVFWRYLKAGRIYLELTGKQDIDADAQVSAESLELADKIRRHAPKQVQEHVLEGALEGTLSRSELRQVWSTYRAGAGGLTARGRLPDDPEQRLEALSSREAAWQAEQRKPGNRTDVRRGELLAACRDPSWVGAYDQARLETRVRGVSGRVSGLLAVRRKADASERVELHGLWTIAAAPELIDFEYAAPSGADFMWLAVHAELATRALERAPRMLGLLSLKRDRALQVLRPAQRRPVHAEGRLTLLSLLLQSAYAWP
jgi:hypothetical protein